MIYVWVEKVKLRDQLIISITLHSLHVVNSHLVQEKMSFAGVYRGQKSDFSCSEQCGAEWIKGEKKRKKHIVSLAVNVQ